MTDIARYWSISWHIPARFLGPLLFRSPSCPYLINMIQYLRSHWEILLTSSGERSNAAAIRAYSSLTLEKSRSSLVWLPCASWQWKTSSLLAGMGRVTVTTGGFRELEGGGRLGTEVPSPLLSLSRCADMPTTTKKKNSNDSFGDRMQLVLRSCSRDANSLTFVQ